MNVRPLLRFAAVLCVAIGFAPAAAAATVPPAPVISSTPALTPAFNPAVTDYGVTCPEGQVNLTATAGKSVTVALDGHPTKTGTQTVTGHLTAGMSLKWTVTTTVKSKKKAVSYAARCIPADMAVPVFTRPGKPTADLYLFNPSGGSGARTGMTFYSMLLDTNGVPLWWRTNPLLQLNGTVMNSTSFATYVPTSLNPLGDFGSGRWAIVNWAGKVLSRIETTGVGYDPHELYKAKSGGYMTLSFEPVQPTNLSSTVDGAPTDAVGYRGYLREVSTTGKLLWSWHASDHIPLSDLSAWARRMIAFKLPLPTLVNGYPAFDIDHISSIEETASGIMIASRHLDAVYMINKTTGAIKWKLGGATTAQSLIVRGDTVGPDTLGAPHDARMLADGTITVMDVGLGHSRKPRMVRFSINTTNKTATVLQQITEESSSQSNCCGTVKRLKSGHWVIGWAGSGLASETDALGLPQLTMALTDHRFSYRVTPFETGAIPHASLRSGMDATFPRKAGS